MQNFTESEIEIFSLDEIKQLGFSYIRGVAPSQAHVRGREGADMSDAYYIRGRD